ncbi:MAG: bifunctional phosphoribosylaminoimidazolecarboxamide formyltransferase/IMP cyclohydrolase, partial [Bacteroidales bacterium]|nr:bifunctional phosphoribosylaminoimidazolecarboxamide formyltransferase/IMP cyclohydrolase [Bacteroidales bacterium]
AALNVVRDFDEPFCVALKHMNPCGAAVGKTIEEAWQAAYEADKVSIYGGIVAVNRELTAEVAAGMKPIFLEIVLAPSYTPEALEILSSKKNLRVMQVDMTKSDAPVPQYISVNGGMLAQQLDTQIEKVTPEMCVTKVKPTADQLADLDFGWKIVKHVKSNAITVVKDNHTVGVGAGQTNRVGSAEIALKEANAAGFTKDLVLASDGFLPFGDTVELAAKYGVTAIVQPGGSIRDEESIQKADELGITMLFTGIRHFKH